MHESNPPSQRIHKLKKRASQEFKSFMAIFIYLWVVFALFSLHESVIQAQHNVDFQAHTLAIVNAFVLAKVLLVGEHLQVGTRFKDKPLIYAVLYKCLLFSLLLVGFHIVERVLVGTIGGKTFEQSFSAIGGGRLWAILSMSALTFVMLIPFFAFRELGRVIGEKQLRSHFLGDKTEVSAIPPSVAQGTEEGMLPTKR
jgi:hypothetical protein